MNSSSNFSFRAAGFIAAKTIVFLFAMGAPVIVAQGVTNARSSAPAVRVIIVSLEDRRLALIENGQVKKVYTVAVGKPSTPSPVGSFAIVNHVANPTYSHNGVVAQPGPNSPVGTRWMGLNIQGYGIHGTNAPGSIGKAASHGCIRMGRADLEEFFKLVRAGDQVEIIGERNEQTARLFGAPSLPVDPMVLPAVLAASPVQVRMPDADVVSLAALNVAQPVAAAR